MGSDRSHEKAPLILIVDDSNSFRSLLGKTLENEGYRTLEAEDGKQAVKLFLKKHPDLILMDASMPVVDGFRACAEINKYPQGKLTPVIMVTGSDEAEYVDKAFAAGAHEYVRKPVHLPILIHRIRLVIERKRTMEALEDQKTRLHSILDTAAEGVIVIDDKGRIESVNRAAQRIFNYTEAETLNQHFAFLLNAPNRDQNEQFIKKLLKKKKKTSGSVSTTLELEAVRKGGETFPIKLSVSAVRLANDQLMLTGIVRDITERKKAEQLIHYQANFDALTDLPNRPNFMRTLEKNLQEAKRNGEKLGLIFIDLDRFKWVNDSLGHPEGDVLLQESGARIRAIVGQQGFAARLGGDEFTAIVRSLKSKETAIKYINRILDVLNEPFILGGKEVFISGSIGMAIFPQDAEDMENLLKRSDEAMYSSKKAGRNAWHLCSGEHQIREKRY
ncbi:MAG: diguanylate cyclase [Magnetococcales bacterium]|nr:diguanylate cyclase [Magnetococcales bacterium]